MKTMKRIMTFALAMILVIGSIPAMPASAAGTPVVYNGNEMEVFKNRTPEMVAQKRAEALAAGSGYNDNKQETWYSKMASLQAPYAQGSLSADTVTAMNAMTEYYRWLVGVKPLAKTATTTDVLQKGALVRNFSQAHTVDDSKKPADMDASLWNAGAAAKHNILSFYNTPRGSVNSWVNEGYSYSSASNGTWGTIGHRSFIIGADVSAIEYGYSGKVSIGYVTEKKNTWGTNAFAAYPAPGYMSVNDVRASRAAWSVELNPSVLEYASYSKVKVKVTDLSNNTSYECTESNGKLKSFKEFTKAITFQQPFATEYKAGVRYRVEITGITDVKTKSDAKIVYEVEFFDDNLRICDHSALIVRETKPDCTHAGEIVMVCNACKEEVSREIVPALGHKWSDWTTTQQAGDHKAGMQKRTCGRCSATETRTIPWTNCPSVNYTDVGLGTWYHYAVDYVVENGFMSGVSSTVFGSNNSVSRSMLVTVLWRAAGSPAGYTHSFSDVKAGSWYEAAVAWAVTNNIVAGVGNNSFAPNQAVTREQAAVFLYRFAAYQGRKTSQKADLSVFPDSGKVHSYAKDALQWAVFEGLISGRTTKENIVILAPLDEVSRAQFAKILEQYMK